MSNKQMNQLTNLPTMASDDLLVVYDIDGAGNEKTKNMTYSQFHSQISGTVGGGSESTLVDPAENDHILFPQAIHNLDVSKDIHGFSGENWIHEPPVPLYDGPANSSQFLALRNGGFVVVYIKGLNGALISTSFNVYDSDEVKVASEIDPPVPIGRVGLGTLTNGNWVMAFKDASSFGQFIIYDEQGNVVKSTTQFATVTITYEGAVIVPLSNGTFMLIFGEDRNAIYTAIFDQDGIEILPRPAPIVRSVYSNYMAASLTHEGNILVNYVDDGDYESQFSMLSPAGEELYFEVLKTDCNDYPKNAVLNNGNFVIYWYDDCDTGDGAFVIYDPNYNTVVPFTSSVNLNSLQTIVPLPYGGFATSHGGTFGIIRIWDNGGNLLEEVNSGYYGGGSITGWPDDPMCQLTDGRLARQQFWYNEHGNYQIVRPTSLQITNEPSLESIKLLERSPNPDKPTEGESRIWMSDGVAFGDAGDVLVVSTEGGVTNYSTLFDHSAGTLWPAWENGFDWVAPPFMAEWNIIQGSYSGSAYGGIRGEIIELTVKGTWHVGYRPQAIRVSWYITYGDAWGYMKPASTPNIIDIPATYQPVFESWVLNWTGGDIATFWIQASTVGEVIGLTNIEFMP